MVLVTVHLQDLRKACDDMDGVQIVEPAQRNAAIDALPAAERSGSVPGLGQSAHFDGSVADDANEHLPEVGRR